jgi:hypothetical protein
MPGEAAFTALSGNIAICFRALAWRSDPGRQGASVREHASESPNLTFALRAGFRRGRIIFGLSAT